jgi:predicted outer membrane lipoprotein
MLRTFIGWLIGTLIACAICVFVLPGESMQMGLFVSFWLMTIGTLAGIEWDLKRLETKKPQ